MTDLTRIERAVEWLFWGFVIFLIIAMFAASWLLYHPQVIAP